VGGVHIKHFHYFSLIDIMSAMLLDAESSGYFRFAPKQFFCAVIGLKWGVYAIYGGQN
jgi:hypothetical protein